MLLSVRAWLTFPRPNRKQKAAETKGSSHYLVSAWPQGRKCGKWGMCRPVLGGVVNGVGVQD